METKLPLHQLDFKSNPNSIHPFKILTRPNKLKPSCQPSPSYTSVHIPSSFPLPFTSSFPSPSCAFPPPPSSSSIQFPPPSSLILPPPSSLPTPPSCLPPSSLPMNFQELAYKFHLLRQNKNPYSIGLLGGGGGGGREGCWVDEEKREENNAGKEEEEDRRKEQVGVRRRKKEGRSKEEKIEEERAEGKESPIHERVICDSKHLPSPNSKRLINYDELKIYEDECLEEEESSRNSL